MHSVLGRLSVARLIVFLVGVYFGLVGSSSLAKVYWQYYYLQGGFWAGISFLTFGAGVVILIGHRFAKYQEQGSGKF